MIVEVKIPSPGESITEVEIANWLVANGDIVAKDQEIAEIESDKASLQLIATESGKIEIKASIGEPIPVGDVACTIDTKYAQETKKEAETTDKENIITDAETRKEAESDKVVESEKVKVSPLAKKLMDEKNYAIDDIINGLQRISRADVETAIERIESNETHISEPEMKKDAFRNIQRNRMSSLRRKLSQRLVAVKNETAMLTTFNEIDMSFVMALRSKYKADFQEKHGVKLGFMSFFTKAVTISLKKFPDVGAMIDGEELLTPEFCDVGIAVQAPKGLMVPVLRNAENMSLAKIESTILELAGKARKGKLTIDEMTGGNFTITNGGVFGSLLSTPILNPPQSAILGMHNIVERPVAINGEVKIRPMMYVALSYDHRVIDGATSVGFLISIKNLIENPANMLLEGKIPEESLLGL